MWQAVKKLVLQVSAKQGLIENRRKRKFWAEDIQDEFHVATWNIAAINNNPFEYWVTYSDGAYENFMRDIESLVCSDCEIVVGDIFTDEMFKDLKEELLKLELPKLNALSDLWEKDIRHRKAIQGFLKDKSIGDKRLASMPDRITNTINLKNGTKIMRPTIINAFDECCISSMELWWKAWKRFMFLTDVEVAMSKGKESKRQKVCQLIGPIHRSKYPVITAEEQVISVQLQLLYLAILDAIFIFIANKIAASSWENIRRTLSRVLIHGKDDRECNILAAAYSHEHAIFIQEASAAFVSKARGHTVLSVRYELAVPDRFDGKRDQNSVIFVSRYHFDLATLTDVTDQVLAFLEGDFLDPGDLFVLSVQASARSGGDGGGGGAAGGRWFLLASFHGDSNGLSARPALTALRRAQRAQFAGHALVAGVDANTAAHGRDPFHPGVRELRRLLRALGLVSSWDGPAGADPLLSTAYCARTSLQPQLHKAVSHRHRFTDANVALKDWILAPRELCGGHSGGGMREVARDNTGRRAFAGDILLPSTDFPSDHVIVSCVVPLVPPEAAAAAAAAGYDPIASPMLPSAQTQAWSVAKDALCDVLSPPPPPPLAAEAEAIEGDEVKPTLHDYWGLGGGGAAAAALRWCVDGDEELREPGSWPLLRSSSSALLSVAAPGSPNGEDFRGAGGGATSAAAAAVAAGADGAASLMLFSTRPVSAALGWRWLQVLLASVALLGLADLSRGARDVAGFAGLLPPRAVLLRLRLSADSPAVFVTSGTYGGGARVQLNVDTARLLPQAALGSGGWSGTGAEVRLGAVAWDTRWVIFRLAQWRRPVGGGAAPAACNLLDVGEDGESQVARNMAAAAAPRDDGEESLAAVRGFGMEAAGWGNGSGSALRFGMEWCGGGDVNEGWQALPFPRWARLRVVPLHCGGISVLGAATGGGKGRGEENEEGNNAWLEWEMDPCWEWVLDWIVGQAKTYSLGLVAVVLGAFGWPRIGSLVISVNIGMNIPIFLAVLASYLVPDRTPPFGRGCGCGGRTPLGDHRLDLLAARLAGNAAFATLFALEGPMSLDMALAVIAVLFAAMATARLLVAPTVPAVGEAEAEQQWCGSGGDGGPTAAVGLQTSAAPFVAVSLIAGAAVAGLQVARRRARSWVDCRLVASDRRAHASSWAALLAGSSHGGGTAVALRRLRLLVAPWRGRAVPRQLGAVVSSQRSERGWWRGCWAGEGLCAVESLHALFKQAAQVDPLLGHKAMALAATCRGRVFADATDAAFSPPVDNSEPSSHGPEGGGGFAAESGLQGRLKPWERAAEKVARCYGGDSARLLDCCRRAMVFDQAEDLLTCLEDTVNDTDLDVLRIKNRLDPHCDTSETGGYRNVVVNLRLRTPEALRRGLKGHVCELQLLLSPLISALTPASHRRYQVLRNCRQDLWSAPILVPVLATLRLARAVAATMASCSRMILAAAGVERR